MLRFKPLIFLLIDHFSRSFLSFNGSYATYYNVIVCVAELPVPEGPSPPPQRPPPPRRTRRRRLQGLPHQAAGAGGGRGGDVGFSVCKRQLYLTG